VLHYPLLGGAAFGGFVVWHMGYSASAPLFVATPGNAMQNQLGGVIPVSETIFAPWNLAIAALTLVVVAVTAMLLHPRDSSSIEEFPYEAEATTIVRAESAGRRSGPAEWLEASRLPTLCLGLLLCAFAAHWFSTKGLQLDLNIVNWTFLAAGLLLARSARDYAQALYIRSTAALWGSCSAPDS
jgi:short-chain fatty acids transporter